jgi:hypothetical protein
MRIQRIALLLATFPLMGVAADQSSEPAKIPGKAIVREVLGTAKVTINGVTKRLKPNMELDAGVTIMTAPKSIVYISVNGMISSVCLEADTTMAIRQMDRASTNWNADSDTRIELKSGCVLGALRRLSEHSSYEIVTPSGQAESRWGGFVVSVDLEGLYPTTFSSVEGPLVVSARVGHEMQTNELTIQTWTPEKGSPCPTPQELIDRHFDIFGCRLAPPPPPHSRERRSLFSLCSQPAVHHIRFFRRSRGSRFRWGIDKTSGTTLMKIIQHIIVALIAIPLMAVAADKSSEPCKSSGRAIVRAVIGTATGTVNGVTKLLKPNTELSDGTTIDTGPDSVVYLNVNGLSSSLRMEADTTLTILRMDRSSARKNADTDTTVDLKCGTIIGEIKKLSGSSSYEVRTLDGTAQIHVGDFAIKVVENPNSAPSVTFSCLKGKLSASALVKGAFQSYELREGKERSPGNESPNSMPFQIVDYYMALISKSPVQICCPPPPLAPTPIIRPVFPTGSPPRQIVALPPGQVMPVSAGHR